MNYVELEEKLITSIGRTYPFLDDDLRIEVYRVSRSINWINVFLSPKRSIEGIRESLSDDIKEFIYTITTAASLRHPEFRIGTNQNAALVEVISNSICWISESKFYKDSVLENIVFNRDEMDEYLSSSPDIIVLYMLSFIGLNLSE